MRPLALVLIVTLLAGPASAYAGQATGEPRARPAENGRAKAASDQPVKELPVSVERIRRKLAQAPASKTSGLRLEYYVEVYGKSPQIDIFNNFDATAGAVQYGSPTHQEFLNLVTPQEFKSPPADLLTPAMALMKWLIDKGLDKSKKKSDPPR
ncbi:MAG: hypothetical protein ACRD1S_18100 [Vicinamibacterales bacterium]